MTLTRMERLVRRARGVLQGSESGGGQVAVDLAEVCREANRRIEECAGSLRRGDLAGAMDLAESEPALVEQIRVLLFPEFQEWGRMCREQGWNVPEIPELAEFQKLQKAFQEARKREVDPHLLQAFRAAMVAGDRPSALRVLATVLRRRPGDAWASGEKAKLLTKESETKLRKLEALLQAGDLEGLVRETDEFEQLGLDPRTRPEIYEQACQRRLEHRQAAARQRVLAEIRRAEELRAADQWREVEILLEETASLLEETGARPPTGYAWQELHAWASRRRQETESQQKLRREEEAVRRELAALEEARARGESPAGAGLTESIEKIRSYLEMGGAGAAVWPESIFLRLRKELDLLEADRRRARRKRVWFATGGLAGLLALAGGVVFWKQEDLRQQMFLREIRTMIESRDLEGAEAWLQSSEAKAAETSPWGTKELNRLRSFLEKEKELEAQAERDLERVENLARDPQASPRSRWEAWQALEPSLAKVHPRWREALIRRREQLQENLRNLGREELQKKTAQARADLQKVAKGLEQWEKKSKDRLEDLASLKVWREELRVWEEWRAEKEVELAMPAALVETLDRLVLRADTSHRQLEDYLATWQKLSQVRSLEEYRALLERLVKNPRLSPPDFEKISQVLESWASPEGALQKFWLPWLKEPLAGLSGNSSLRLAPATLNGKEDALLKEIMEDHYLHNLWRYEVPVAPNSTALRTLYSLGPLRLIPEDPFTYGEGEVFFPQDCAKDEEVRFEKRPKGVELGSMRMDQDKLLVGFRDGARGIAEANSKYFHPIRRNLEKALSEDAGAPLARAPIQEALDQIVPATPGISPLARAYFAQQVWRLASISQDPLRFGLVFSPALLQAAERWEKLGPVEPGIWLKKEAGDLDPHWQKEMASTEVKRFAEEAKLAAHLFEKAKSAGLTFAGWVHPEEPADLQRLVNLEAGQTILGQGPKGALVTGYVFDGKNWKKNSDLRPYSPLYLAVRSPRALLEEAVRSARVEPGWAERWVKEMLPALFGGGS